MSSLRSRLIVSHTLPLLITIPIIGLVLIYVLETQVLFVNLSQQLTRQANLLHLMAADYPEIWQSQVQAQEFVNRFSVALSAHFMLLTPDGVLLAASPLPQSIVGTRLDLPELPLQQQEPLVKTSHSNELQDEVIDVFVPVEDTDHKQIGIVRLTHVYATIYGRIWRLRYLTLGILAAGLLISVAVGSGFALSLERPMVRLTQALQRFALGAAEHPLAEEGSTEVRTLIRTFNHLVTQLQQQEGARKRLLATIIHEIRRPLGALTSATHALHHGAAKDEMLRTELLQGMTNEFQHIRQLIDDLTLLDEQTRGPLALARRPTVIQEWLTTTLAPWHTAAAEKGVAWEVTLPEALPTVAIDGARLGQAVGNLVSNAIKFTPTAGRVTISAGATTTHLWISVADTGPGLTPEEQHQIFEPFYRSQSHRRFAEGMGLGLTIARDLVEAHGGRLTVTSSPAGGSQFTIELPC